MDFSSLTLLDYIILGIIGFSTFFALVRGFIGSLLSLAGWILSIYLAYALFPVAQPYIQSKINNELVVLILGHSILLLFFLIAFGVFNMVSAIAFKPISKGIIDRTLGAGFGILRGGLIVCFVFLVTTTMINVFQGGGKDPSDNKAEEFAPKWLKDSQTYPLLKIGKGILEEFMPSTFQERIEKLYEKVTNKTVDENFMDNAADLLYQHLTEEQKEQIGQIIGDDALTMSQDEADKKKLKEMLKMIRNNSSAGVSKRDLNRLEDLLNKTASRSKPATTSEEPEAVQTDEDIEGLE